MKPDANLFKVQQGFTLVELMVTLVIAFIITGAAYAAYIVQQKNYTVQEQVAEVQQNIRNGLEIMSGEMRMAGYDPTFSGEYGIDEATATRFRFTADLCGDGGTPATAEASSCGIPEKYLYELYDSSGNDGVVDALRRTENGSAVAENIEYLEFLYTLKDGTRTQTPTALELKKIVTVEISILARASEEDHKYQDTQTYTTAAGIIIDPADKKYRRRMLISTLQLRNMAYRS
jgi:type IV pilus assembly protein PilW